MTEPNHERIVKAYETAAADLAAAGDRLQKAKDRKIELRRELNSCDCECSNAFTQWEKRRDALLKIIEEQGKP